MISCLQWHQKNPIGSKNSLNKADLIYSVIDWRKKKRRTKKTCVFSVSLWGFKISKWMEKKRSIFFPDWWPYHIRTLPTLRLPVSLSAFLYHSRETRDVQIIHTFKFKKTGFISNNVWHVILKIYISFVFINSLEMIEMNV